MKGYFRFSRYAEEMNSLAGWAMWFSFKKILWFIERKPDPSHPESCYLFALWRQGKEMKGCGDSPKKQEYPHEIYHLAIRK